MKTSHRFTSTSALRAGSCAVIASLIVPLTGCGSPAPPPTISQSSPSMSRPAMNQNTGMSGKQKLVLLAGAAALYYYYRKSKAANEQKYNQKITYYRSKNGGIYYRDPTDKNVPPRPIWVQPPTQTVQVPATEAQQYSQIQGYNGQQSGRGLDYYFGGQGGAESAGM